MVKDSYQCMNYFYDFGPQQEISYEFSVNSLLILKGSVNVDFEPK